jgi:Lrp/AsnC family leucine-responsive transcriptional regulator
MTLQIEIDPIDVAILEQLQDRGRLSFSQLGRRVGLSAPAATERVRKLVDAGVITGTHARIDPLKLGYAISAFVQLSCEARHYAGVVELCQELPEVAECHHVSGSDAFILKVHVTSVGHLERLVTRLSDFGRTATTLILSSPVQKTGLTPPDSSA